MERQQFEPTWPFLCVLVGLSIIGATSPGVWRDVAQERALNSPIEEGAVSFVTVRNEPSGTAKTELFRSAGESPELCLVKIELVGKSFPDTTVDATVRGMHDAVQSVSARSPVIASSISVTDREKTALAQLAPSQAVGSEEESIESSSSLSDSVPEGEKVESSDPLWFPMSPAVGPMPMAGRAQFDPSVLPVRRPCVSSDADEVLDVAFESWTEPKNLLEMLDELAWDCDAGFWAREVSRLTCKLGHALDESSPQSASILSDLSDLSRQVDQMANRITEYETSSRLIRAGHALERRLDLWRHVIVPGKPLTGSWKVNRPNAASPVDVAELLERLERYESSGSCSDAKSLSKVCWWLVQSSTEPDQRLNERFQTHYRNANLRIAISELLLNEVTPARQLEYKPVHDTVLGNPVHGRSTNESDVVIRLIPDATRLRLALDVRGTVSSRTASSSGPATFYSHGKSIYRASRDLELGTWGIRVWPVTVDLDHDTWLRSLETNLDGIPLLGQLAYGVARNQHDRALPMADQEVEWKMASRIKWQVEKESQARLELLSDMLDQRVFSPLKHLGLKPVTISAQTTEQRLVTRMRLATDTQLGSSTPRPEAPADSLLSLQVHESAFCNVIDRLELDGQAFMLGDLRRHVAEKLNLPKMGELVGEQDDVVKIRFANENAVHARLRDGCLTLTFSIARLSKLDRAPRHWSNFQVRVRYRPEVQGRTVQLVREGVVQLIGRMPVRSQFPLRGVVCKTFPKSQPWVITPARLETDSCYRRMSITQFVIEDGWFGFALGPIRPATRIARAQ